MTPASCCDASRAARSLGAGPRAGAPSRAARDLARGRARSLARAHPAPRRVGPPRGRDAGVPPRATNEADDGRDAAAAAAKLAPLDVTTMVGAELELVMKVDPASFERALTDQVRRDPAPPPRNAPSPRTRPTDQALGRDETRIGGNAPAPVILFGTLEAFLAPPPTSPLPPPRPR